MLALHKTIVVNRSEQKQLFLDFSQQSMLEYDITVTVLQDASIDIVVQLPRAVHYTLRLTLNLSELRAEANCSIVEDLVHTTQGTIVTRQQHNAQSTKSTLLVRSVLRDAAQSSYYGTIRIGEMATGAVAVQNSATLLLGAAVKTEATPSLEILTDDVSCKHGSSCGTVSPEHLFYLQTRGIAVTEGTELLVAGFLDEVRSKLEQSSLSHAQ